MYFQCLRKVGKFIVEQNEMVYLPRGLLLTNPAERGLRIVSLNILVFINYYRGHYCFSDLLTIHKHLIRIKHLLGPGADILYRPF
jgi:hypothetical protein